MHTIPRPHRLRGAARTEHDPNTDASELWNRTATPETLTKLADMALALASVPGCSHHNHYTQCRYEIGEVPNCTECRLQWAFERNENGNEQN